MANFKNSFEITGTVVSYRKAEKALRITVVTSPFGKTDYPNIIVFDNIDEIAENIDRGTRLTAKGYVQTSRQNPRGSLIATEVTIENSRLECEFDRLPFKADKNTVLIAGILTRTPKVFSPNITSINVQTLKPNDAPTYPFISTFDNTAHRMSEKKAGDEISALCYCQTRYNKEKHITYQSIVAQSIV
jgi:hypothetical protein